MPKTKSNVKNLMIITILLLFLLTIFTKYYGSTDIGDYADTAKFFSGNYQAKLRSSHSILYGLIHSPLIKLTNSFIFLKLSSVLWLSLLILSVYYISKKNKKTLLLFITAPIIWYMAPWINSIQLSSLLFLWGYYFIQKYELKGKVKNIIYSGLLIGLAWAFWDAIVYFALVLAIFFFYDKKLTHFLLFFLALFIGDLPKLITDQILFGFAFYSILKHFFGIVSSALYGGVYGRTSSRSFLSMIFVLLVIPFFTFILYKKKIFLKNKKTILFLTFSLIMILFTASQIRYTLLITPIIILILSETLNKKQFKIQILIFLILSLLVINPYLIQIKYEIKGREFQSFILNLPNLQLNSTFSDDLILQDLEKITEQYPNQTFIIGNEPDDYQLLAHLYWKDNVKEFVSIQDYNLFLENKSILFEKTIISKPKINDRRQIWISGGIKKSDKDSTDYNSIKLGISIDEPLNFTSFQLLRKYKILYLYEKK